MAAKNVLKKSEAGEMGLFSDKFNKLPIEVRNICSVITAETRISQLEIEKDRLKKRYNSSLAEINSHIKNLQKYIIEEEGKAKK